MEDTTAGFRLIPGATIARTGADTAEDVLRVLSRRLRDLGAVTADFERAVLAREAAYPTGLPTVVPVAIPHTDPEHVLSAGFAVATTEVPVAFGEMGTPGRTVEARLVVMLVIADAHLQVAALQHLVARLGDEPAVLDVIGAADDEDLARRVSAWLAAGA